MQANAEEVDSHVADPDHDKTCRRDRRSFPWRPVLVDSSVEVDSVEQPGHEGPGLLGIPAATKGRERSGSSGSLVSEHVSRKVRDGE